MKLNFQSIIRTPIQAWLSRRDLSFLTLISGKFAMNAAAAQDTPLVGIIMGSQSDWATLEHTANMLKQLGVPFEAEVVSAHRTPDRLFEYAEQARDRGIQVIIAGATNAAIMAAQILGLTRPDIAKNVADFRAAQTDKVASNNIPGQA